MIVQATISGGASTTENTQSSTSNTVGNSGSSVAGVASELIITRSSGTLIVGSPISVKVTVADSRDSPVTNFTGTINLSYTHASANSTATLPIFSHTFSAAEQGVFTFSGIIFNNADNYTLIAQNKSGQTVLFSNSITLVLSAATSTQSTDATLSALSLSNGTISPTFTSGTTSYTASITNTTTSINVSPTVNQANAKVKVNGVTTTSGTASTSLPMNVGANAVTVLTTAQDGSTQTTYTITVTRAAPSNVATLSALTLSSGTLSPTFATNTTSYTASIDYTVSSITLTPTVTQTFTSPANCPNISVQMWGAGGSGISYYGNLGYGGGGGFVDATMNMPANKSYKTYIGGGGAPDGTGGYWGGGSGFTICGEGGRSSIRDPNLSDPSDLTAVTELLVAGGGGGARAGVGGEGGGLQGGGEAFNNNNHTYKNGGGGTQTAGGTGGGGEDPTGTAAFAGSSGIGGTSTDAYDCGGGGGYFGGGAGGGYGRQGGGGSSYLGPYSGSTQAATGMVPYNSNNIHPPASAARGGNLDTGGNGYAMLYWGGSASDVSVSGNTVTVNGFNLTSDTTVKIDGSTCSGVNFVSSDQLTCTATLNTGSHTAVVSIPNYADSSVDFTL